MQIDTPFTVRRIGFLVALCAIAAVSVSAVALAGEASAGGASGIDWLELNMGLFGGLALFLAGLEVLSEGLKKTAGNALRDVLAKLTVNRFMGALTGAFVTGVLNASSVTTVLVVGFVTAGVMTLAQSVGVIMGANIGSTVTAQILAFNVAAYSLIPVAVGFFMFFAAKNDPDVGRERHTREPEDRQDPAAGGGGTRRGVGGDAAHIGRSLRLAGVDRVIETALIIG